MLQTKRNFKGGPPTTGLSAEKLTQMGYRRVSNAYGLVARIDRSDWLDVLANSLPGRCIADFLVRNGPDAGKPSPRWEDHYRRVYSKDVHTVSAEDITRIPPSF